MAPAEHMASPDLRRLVCEHQQSLRGTDPSGAEVPELLLDCAAGAEQEDPWSRSRDGSFPRPFT